MDLANVVLSPIIIQPAFQWVCLAICVNPQVDSKASLATAWRADPTFLKRQLCAWLRKDTTAAVDSVWPQLLAEAQQVP